MSPSRSEHVARLPSFIAVGPPRTGTTWLHDSLAARVCLPRVKETAFFSVYWDRGIDFYANQFRHGIAGQTTGEVCPYFSWAETPARIATYIPDCKIICTLRDPVDRLSSHYRVARCNVYVRGDFDNAIATLGRLIEGSRYATYLPAWFKQFGRENVLVTLYDDLHRDPQRYLDQVCDFVGIARIPEGGVRRRVNERYLCDRRPRSDRLASRARHFRDDLYEHGYLRAVELLDRIGLWAWCGGGGALFPPLTPEQDARMREIYRPDIERLEELLGRDFSAWKVPRASRAA